LQRWLAADRGTSELGSVESKAKKILTVQINELLMAYYNLQDPLDTN